MAFTIRPKFVQIKPDLDPAIVKEIVAKSAAPAPKPVPVADFVCEKFAEASLEEQKDFAMVLEAFERAKVVVPNACKKCKELPNCAVKVAYTMATSKLRRTK